MAPLPGTPEYCPAAWGIHRRRGNVCLDCGGQLPTSTQKGPTMSTTTSTIETTELAWAASVGMGGWRFFATREEAKAWAEANHGGRGYTVAPRALVR
jgi:hypothetical protein